jgi:23S rRNA (cytidine1920-2'-O)/16S rRNA (cytidine1409-2'-O)-methyltransferase
MTEAFPYVSRGALKLKRAIETFGIDLAGKTIADIGASTGGFTDYALQNGADKVYAIDCGYGQLDQKLRNDKRVINMERTNIKDVEALPDPIDIFVIDVSFISLKKILPQVITIIRNSKFEIRNSSDIIALIKPQFEVGKEVADRYRGVIKDENIRQEVVTDIKNFATKSGYIIEGLTDSPIKGAKGNKEFLLYMSLRA